MKVPSPILTPPLTIAAVAMWQWAPTLASCSTSALLLTTQFSPISAPAGAEIGENCVVNSNALVEHDAKVGAHCHIATAAIVNGGVRIGDGTFIGSGAVTKQGVSVGHRCVVGAGSVVLGDVDDNELVK